MNRPIALWCDNRRIQALSAGLRKCKWSGPKGDGAASWNGAFAIRQWVRPKLRGASFVCRLLGVVGESRSVKAVPDLLCQQQIEVLFTPIMLWRITRFCALSFAPAKNGLAKLRVRRQFHDQFLGPLASGWF